MRNNYRTAGGVRCQCIKANISKNVEIMMIGNGGFTVAE